MRRSAVLAAVALGIGIIGSLYWVAHLAPRERSDVSLPKPNAVVADFVPSHSSVPAVRTAALGEMSESFRNSTLLIAIRRGGFYCDDVVASHETTAGIWVASCRDLSGYTVNVEGAAALQVEPIPHHYDAVF